MLTTEERKQLAAVITESAFFYGKTDLTKEGVSLYITTLDKVFNRTFQDYQKAFEFYLRDQKNKFFPAPAHLSQYLNPEMSSEAAANDVASRIRKAISDFGYLDPKGARAYIGELGWEVVQRAGGWQYICEHHGVDLSPLTFFAQCRDAAKSIFENAKIGLHNDAPAIPYHRDHDVMLNDKKRNEILRLSDHLKSIKQASETVANQPDAKPKEQHKPTTAHSNESIEVGAQAVNKI